MALYVETQKLGDEELDFYPEEYLNTLADKLECFPKELCLITSVSRCKDDWDEMWDINELKAFMEIDKIKKVETLADDYQVCIGSIEVCRIDDKVTVIAEQNASPVCFWISESGLEDFRTIKIRKS